MTSGDDRRREFLDRCLTGGDNPGAVRIDGSADRGRRAQRYAGQSQYHRIAADDHLNGDATLMAIREGYYAMFHKANEAIVRAGFEPKSHHCTLLGLRGLFERPSLADTLRRAGEERTNVDYGMNPEDPELVEFQDPAGFVDSTVDPFIDEVDALIDAEL